MSGGLDPFGVGGVPSFASGSPGTDLSPNLGSFTTPQQAPAPSAPPATSLTDAINTIPQTYGVDPTYLRKMAVAESGGDLNAKAATSSATGPYQIIGSTADSLGLDRADRSDPTKATHAISQFTADNAAGLRQAGFDTTHGNLYLSHFAGLGGAKSVLGADPSTPVSSLLPSSSIEANPFLRGMSAGDLTAWADRKMSGAGSSMQMPASAGGAARSAGFGMAGPMQGAAPAGGATMTMPGDQASADQASNPSLSAAIRSLAAGGGKAPGQGQQAAADDLKPFAFSPVKPRVYRPLTFASMIGAGTRGTTR